MKIKPGLYEQLVTERLLQEIDRLEPPLKAVCDKLDPEESPFVMGQYLGQSISHLLTKIKGNSKQKKQIDLCNRIFSLVHDVLEQNVDNNVQIDQGAHRLMQVQCPVNAYKILFTGSIKVQQVRHLPQDSVYKK